MKKAIILAVASILSIGGISAQKYGDHKQRSVEDRVNDLKQELNLTDDQVKKVKAIYTDFDNKAKTASKDSKSDFRAEREKLDKKVEAVLTKDQKAKFQQNKKQHSHNRSYNKSQKN